MLGSSWAKTTAKRLLRAKAAASQGLATNFFDGWQPEFDKVLQSLPETDIFPHELFHMLMDLSDPKAKKIILVTEKGEPVALAGLRNRWGYWEPITQWIVPGVLFPVKEGYIARVLAALGLEVRIAWWRWDSPPPENDSIIHLKSTPTHGICCSEDFEQYWRNNDNWKDIRLYRNRCRDFDLRVDLPGSTEWTIRNWEAKWRPQNIPQMPDLAERLLVAQYLEGKGLCHTLSLVDGDKITASLTFTIHRDDAVAHYNYRNPEYNRQGVMNRLMDLGFYWVRDMGFQKIDLGGSFDYKDKWAPENGEKWEFSVCPSNIMFERRASELLRKARGCLGIFSGDKCDSA
jgi:hypothetical protein